MDVGEISCWRRSKLNLPPPLVQFARLFNRHFSEGKFILERIELFLKKYPHSPKLIEQFFFSNSIFNNIFADPWSQIPNWPNGKAQNFN